MPHKLCWLLAPHDWSKWEKASRPVAEKTLLYYGTHEKTSEYDQHFLERECKRCGFVQRHYLKGTHE